MRLSFNDVSNILSYEPETGLLRWKVDRSRLAKTGCEAGALHPNGYVYVKIKGKSYRAHRLAWLLNTGSLPPEEIDHINGCRSDNRLVNLRPATRSQNQHNRGVTANNKSGKRGVSLFRQSEKWMASIRINGKRIHLGLYCSIEEAAQAYAEASQKYHGDRGRTA